jgi:thiamine kinase
VTATADARVRAALEGFERGRGALAAGVRLAPLAGGVENSSVRVSSAAGDWVVRIAGPRDARFAINRVAERQVHAAAAALGFAPAIVHVDTEQGLLVTEHVAGQPWTRDEVRSPAGLKLLGARLAELHAQPLPRAVRRMNVHDVLAHYLEQPVTTPGPMSRADLAARLRWSLATYRPAPPALCHNDLHHLNLLGRAPLLFVDWEYAAVGDPVFELAAVIGYHDLDPEQRELLLAAYGRELRRAHVARMCLVFDCLHALWLEAADAWRTLSPERREALLARLAIDPADRRR